ncbi:hypothetical protein B1964_19740 [Gordonia sp. i37]|nr:hypothetical protein B1964_19740 [Gordonia sp. i37]
MVITDELDRDAGGILPTMALLSCLRRGVEYVAVVRAIAGGAIELNVQARDCTTLRRLVKIRLEPGCSVATGDLLTVEAATGIAAEHRVAVAGGATVGQFDWDEALAACLDEGLRFRAQIVSITDAGVLAVIRGAP